MSATALIGVGVAVLGPWAFLAVTTGIAIWTRSFRVVEAIYAEQPVSRLEGPGAEETLTRNWA